MKEIIETYKVYKLKFVNRMTTWEYKHGPFFRIDLIDDKNQEIYIAIISLEDAEKLYRNLGKFLKKYIKRDFEYIR